MKIKTSNKILLIAGAVPIIFVIILLIVFRIARVEEGVSNISSAVSSNISGDKYMIYDQDINGEGFLNMKRDS